VSAFHTSWGFVAAGISGVVGLWGVAFSRRERPPTVFYYAVGMAIVSLLIQIVSGVIVAGGGIDPGN